MPLNECLSSLMDPVALNKSDMVCSDELLKAMNVYLGSPLTDSTMSSSGVNKSFEKAIQDGLNIDYSILKTQELIYLVSHYVSNHLMKFFDLECDSKIILDNTYQLSEQFFEGTFTKQKFLLSSIMKAQSSSSTCTSGCFSSCTKSSSSDIPEKYLDSKYKVFIDN